MKFSLKIRNKVHTVAWELFFESGCYFVIFLQRNSHSTDRTPYLKIIKQSFVVVFDLIDFFSFSSVLIGCQIGLGLTQLFIKSTPTPYAGLVQPATSSKAYSAAPGQDNEDRTVNVGLALQPIQSDMLGLNIRPAGEGSYNIHELPSNDGKKNFSWSPLLTGVWRCLVLRSFLVKCVTIIEH